MDLHTLIRRLGGQTVIGGKLGIKPNVVSGWMDRNNIPGNYHIGLWRLCMEQEIDWAPPGAKEIETLIFQRHACSLVKNFAAQLPQAEQPAQADQRAA